VSHRTRERLLSSLPGRGAARRVRRPSDAGRTQAVAVTELELEQVVERLARLVLHAPALAERMAASVRRAVDCAARAERIRRLRAAVGLGRRAIQAAVFLRRGPTPRRSASQRASLAGGAARRGSGRPPGGWARLSGQWVLAWYVLAWYMAPVDQRAAGSLGRRPQHGEGGHCAAALGREHADGLPVAGQRHGHPGEVAKLHGERVLTGAAGGVLRGGCPRPSAVPSCHVLIGPRSPAGRRCCP